MSEVAQFSHDKDFCCWSFRFFKRRNSIKRTDASDVKAIKKTLSEVSRSTGVVLEEKMGS